MHKSSSSEIELTTCLKKLLKKHLIDLFAVTFEGNAWADQKKGEGPNNNFCSHQHISQRDDEPPLRSSISKETYIIP